MKRESGILHIAEAVSDGTPVNWEKETPSDEEKARVLENLKAIDRIGSFYRQGEEKTPTLEMDTEVDISRWGSLVVERRLGEGAYGEVFLAHDPDLDTKVALKLLHPSLAQDFLKHRDLRKEARNLARVQHQNVVRVHGVRREGNQVGIWSDFIRGKNLEECLHEEGPFAVAESLNIGLELCRALAAVHAAGLIHGDIKASNVMRERGGRIVLMDFGCSVDRPLPGGNGKTAVSGTPVYMAPELFDGEGVGVATDIYSLGVLLYRLVAGAFPVTGKTIQELRGKHRRHESTPLLDVRPDAQPEFARVIERALDPDPEKRYRSAGEMEQALNAVRSPAPAQRTKRGRRPVLLAAVLGLVLILTAVWPYLRSTPLEVDASIYRMGRGGAEERLQDGSAIGVGDKIFLEFQGSKDLHVFVFNEDETGNAYLLFPLPGLDSQNPLRGNEFHRLPGTREGEEQTWDVTSAGGGETFVVVATLKPREELEGIVADLPRAGEGVSISPHTLERLRGIGGLSPRARAKNEDEGASVSGTARNLAASGNKDLWIWEMHLENSAP